METLDLVKAAAAVISTAVACTWVLRSKLSSIESKLVQIVEKTAHHEARIESHDVRITKLEGRPGGGRKR